MRPSRRAKLDGRLVAATAGPVLLVLGGIARLGDGPQHLHPLRQLGDLASS